MSASRAAAKDPLTPTLSPRGEGVRLRPLVKVSGQFWRPFSPWGEGQDEGGLRKALKQCGITEGACPSHGENTEGFAVRARGASELPPIPGVRLAVAEAGIKYAGRTDVLLALFPEGTQAGGVLTRSKTASAPVDWCRAQLQHGEARALVVNSGNANAFTGWRGRDAVEATAKFAAEAAGCVPEQVFIASTGVIGEPLDGIQI